MPRDQRRTCYRHIASSVHKFKLFQQLRVIWEGRIGARVQLIQDEAAILVQASVHLYFFPEILQADRLLAMALLEVHV